MGFLKDYFSDKKETEFSSVILNGEEINFTLVRSKTVKNLSISINPSRGIRVTAPYMADISKIYEILYQKERWILKHLKKIKSTPKKPGIVSYLGKEYPISIIETSGRERVNFHENQFIINCKNSRNANKILEKWFRKQAKEIILNSVEKYRKHLNSHIGIITIKGQKTRWGSCSSQNNLNFNWKLIMSSREIIDYVVIHELAHTVHHNHSDKFWNLVQQLDPDYKKHRKWLKDNGHSLTLD